MSNFFKEWGKGMKSYAKSPLGQIEAQLLISSFMVVGLFAASVQQGFLANNSLLGFILFAFGFLQCFSVYALWKQYKVLWKAFKVNKKIGGYLK